MGTESTADAVVSTLPVGRAFFQDERGVVMRATWHLDRGFLNMSIWQQNLCVATFQLRVEDTARLASFLTEGLGEAASALLAERAGAPAAAPPPPVPVPVPAPVPPAPATVTTTVAEALAETVRLAANRLADRLAGRSRTGR